MTGLYEDFWVETPAMSPGEVKKTVIEMMAPMLEMHGFTYDKRRNVFFRIQNEQMINVFAYQYCDSRRWEPYFAAVPLCSFNPMFWQLFKHNSDYSKIVTEYEPHTYSDDLVEKRNYAAFSPCIVRRTFDECVQYIRDVLETYAIPLADSVNTWEKYTQCILKNKDYRFPLEVDPRTRNLLIGCYVEEDDWLEYLNSYREWLKKNYKQEEDHYQEMACLLGMISDCRLNNNLNKLEQLLNERALINRMVLQNEHKYPNLKMRNGFMLPEVVQAMQYFCTHSTLSAEDLVASAPEELKDELMRNIDKIKF